MGNVGMARIARETSSPIAERVCARRGKLYGDGISEYGAGRGVSWKRNGKPQGGASRSRSRRGERFVEGQSVGEGSNGRRVACFRLARRLGRGRCVAMNA